MKIWVDDIREPPDATWEWSKSSSDALSLLNMITQPGMCWVPFDVISLDHDLGDDDTTRVVVLWMCENDFWPTEVRVHTANPVGREWLEGMVERYKP